MLSECDTVKPRFHDVSRHVAVTPTLWTGCIYIIATAVSSGVSICTMLAIAAGAQYEYNKEKCTCDCFDRRFKGTHFEPTNQYR